MSIPVISIIKPQNTPVGTGGANPTVEDVDFLGGLQIQNSPIDRRNSFQ